MIEAGSTGSGVEDSGMVSLEDGGVGFNGDGGWSLGNGSLELGDGVGLNVDVRFNVNESLGSVVFASSLPGSVWVD